MIVWTDVLVMPVFHSEPFGDGAKLYETKSLIQMSGMGVALHNGIELKNTESQLFCLLKAIQHQFFANMLPAHRRRNSIQMGSICSVHPGLFSSPGTWPQRLSDFLNEKT